MKKENLKEGEFYWFKPYSEEYVFKYTKYNDGDINVNIAPAVYKYAYYTNSFTTGEDSFDTCRLATAEEKHWLNCCIKQNKFIPKEEALKSFKQEQQFIVGEWYKNSKWYCHNFVKFLEFSNDSIKYTERIYENKYEKIDNWCDAHKSTLVLADLQEIQAFLPKGHEDLINTAPKEESFAILLNNQEELDECIKYAKSKGYKENCDQNDVFNKKSNCFFNVDNNSPRLWWTSSKKFGKNLKTLSDIGITINKEEVFRHEVIHCKTEQEWDFVKSKCSSYSAIFKESWTKDNKQNNYTEGIAIEIKTDSYCGLNYWKKENAKIYSFEEWCNKFNYAPNFRNKEQPLSPIKKEKWIPKKGEFAIMVNAGGWGYSEENNGCIAEITEVKPTIESRISTYRISGKLLNPKVTNYETFSYIPLEHGDYPGEIFCKKALPHEIPVTPKECISSSNSTIADPYMNEIIEVGSIVRFKSKDSRNAKYFKKGLENLIVNRINIDISPSNYKYMVSESDNSQIWGVEEHEIELMTKKASQIQQNNGKKVLSFEPEYKTNTTDNWLRKSPIIKKSNIFEKEQPIRELISTKTIKKQTKQVFV